MEFRVLPIKDRELFLRYAIPCGEVLVNRGELKRELLERMNDTVKQGKEIDFPIEDNFRVASRMCTIIAKRMGKNVIDSEVIRRYFLLEHEKAIRWRKRIRPDIDVKECRVYPGRVLHIDEGHAVVKTPLGEAVLRTNFTAGLRLKEGDWVSKHYGYVSDKLDTSHVNRMTKKK
jgi:hypothetical protein